MTLLSEFAKALTRRPAQAGSGVGAAIGLGLQTGHVAQLQSTGQSSWLYAAINRIVEGTAMVRWHLYRQRANGDRVEVTSHPALALWDRANPFLTRFEFVEATQQHLDLAGESYWVLVGGRQPRELWPVRPDRMRPIPHPEQFIAGYEYRIGGTVLTLNPEDVIQLKYANPLDPYRGLAPVAALLLELGADREAAQYVRAFFKNGAGPGGYVEMDELLPDAEYEKWLLRWREQHQGANNAHRVALLEKGKFHDVKYSLGREMQFVDYRAMNRDTILGAFGMPKSMLGITEDVNRANAEAGEVVFARWLIRPRLERIKNALNESLAPRWGEDLEFDYDDPTPLDRAQAIDEAERGYRARILTRNEARARLGEGEVPDGDEFDTPAPDPFAGDEDEEEDNDDEKSYQARYLLAAGVTKEPDPLLTGPEERAEALIARNWTGRLAREADGLVAHIEPKGIKVLDVIPDVDSWDWEWWDKYHDDVIDELVRVFEIGALAAEPGLTIPTAQALAADYARRRAAELLRVDGDANLITLTKRRVGELVAQSIERGDSLQTLQKALREDYAFGRARAESIARTETATALGKASIQAGVLQGRTEKRWTTQADGHVDDPVCRANERQGWIKIGDMFQSGHDTVPGHSRCRCVVRTRTEPVSTVDPENAETIARAVHCPQCKRRLPVSDLEGSCKAYCKRCDKSFEVGA